jgi:ComF family protein
MTIIREIKQSLLHLLFPHVCSGCGSDLLSEESQLCLQCLAQLPGTDFHMHANNPVERIFWGRLPLASATAQYYFTKESLMQTLMHHFKYRGDKELGKQLGRLMGNQLTQANRFSYIDALVPLPLFPGREKRRGYNQATVLCEGMAETMNADVITNSLIRPQYTETQTKKGRMERWKNIDGKFELQNPRALQGKHVLLVDDVVTTGATLEACGQEILKAPGIQLSIATLCYAFS